MFCSHQKGAIVINTKSSWELNIRAREIWLNYFNRCALDSGIITESEFRRLQSMIMKRSAELTRQHTKADTHSRADT